MIEWTADRIMQALGRWSFWPDGSEVIETDDYLLTFFPQEWGGGASVQRVESARSASEIVDEVNELALERGWDHVDWSIYPTTRPADLDAVLLARGGWVAGEGGLMSLQVPADGSLDVGPTDGVTVHPVHDLGRLADYRRTQSAVYEQPMPGPEGLAAEAATIDPADRGYCRFVGYLDGRPGGTGTIAVRDDGAASLFGAATLEPFRGRGIYRSILAARTTWAREHDVEVLLVKGVIDTSFPILKRVGFTHHGYTRTIRTPNY